MSLVSNVFILFVAGSVAIYYILPQKVQWCGLLVMSYIYYLAAGSKYILFLLFSTIVTYVSGRLIGSQIGKDKRKAKKFLIAGLILNFGMLGVVKYTNFILENMNLIFHVSIPGMKLLLPLGISFYTFQSSGYLLDVYWKEIQQKRILFVMHCLYLISRRFCRDRLDDTVKWPDSCMKDINLN